MERSFSRLDPLPGISNSYSCSELAEAELKPADSMPRHLTSVKLGVGGTTGPLGAYILVSNSLQAKSSL